MIRIGRFKLGAIIALMATSIVTVSQNSPSVSAEAQDLQRQVEQAMRLGDMPTVLLAMDRYHQLRQPTTRPLVAPWPVPPQLSFAEAKAAFAEKDSIRAAQALETFIKAGSGYGSEYAEALALRERYQKAATAAQAARRVAAQAGRSRLAESIEQQMVGIPAGSFQMGDLSGRGQPRGKVISVTVTIKAFHLSRYEVTFEEYDAYADATGKVRPSDHWWGRGNLPVEAVSWNDAQGFIAWLNESTGHKFRLPTEAEWEYAARAGSHDDYPWGEIFDPRLANGEGTCTGDNWDRTAPTGSFPPNAWGLYDMIGNVWEWTLDCDEGRYEDVPPDGGARQGLPDCRRVIRGGAWDLPAPNLRISNRLGSNPGSNMSGVGFRLAED